MTSWTVVQATDWLEVAREREVWDIGQLTPADKRRLDRAAKRGELVKSREYWGGLGNLRSVWRPIARPSR